MNGTETITLAVGPKTYRVRFVGPADVPRAGRFRIEGEGEAEDICVRLDLEFLWAADAAMDEAGVTEQVMRTVGIKCVEAYLGGKLEKAEDGVLSVTRFIGRRYPDYTSVERFIGSLYDTPGRLVKMCRDDVLRILLAAAGEEERKSGLSVWDILASPAKRRFYSTELLHDAIVFWEGRGLLETVGESARLRDDRIDRVRSMLGGQ